jgi:hypothetical protein
MLHDPLRMIWMRLVSEPPLVTGDEMCSRLGPMLAALESQGILRPDKSVEELPCTDCGSGHICRVHFVKDERTGQQVASICCPECGAVFIDNQRLKRWRIDIAAFLSVISQSAGIRSCLSEVVPGLLWRLGKANWAGHAREVCFVRRCRGNEGLKIEAELSSRKKSIVLTTTAMVARKLSTVSPNPVFALDSVASFSCDHFLVVDNDYLESRLLEVEVDRKAAKKPPAKRRSSRTADMDALKRELIEHIKAARDHAVTTRDRTGEAMLLPRPSKEELGKRASVMPHSVTRCFQDEQGYELRTMWRLAEDLDRIIGSRT